MSRVPTNQTSSTPGGWTAIAETAGPAGAPSAPTSWKLARAAGSETGTPSRNRLTMTGLAPPAQIEVETTTGVSRAEPVADDAVGAGALEIGPWPGLDDPTDAPDPGVAGAVEGGRPTGPVASDGAASAALHAGTDRTTASISSEVVPNGKWARRRPFASTR